LINAKAYTSGKMESDMKASGRMESFTGKVSKLCQMELYSMESGLKGGLMEWEHASTLTMLNTQAVGLMVNRMVKESKLCLMEQNTQEIGLMEKLTVEV